MDSGVREPRSGSCQVTRGRSPDFLSLYFHISKKGDAHTHCTCSQRWMGDTAGILMVTLLLVLLTIATMHCELRRALLGALPMY